MRSDIAVNDLGKLNPSAGTWEWVGGSYSTSAFGVCGTLGVASMSNFPGARTWANSWTDSSGNLWLLGAYGYSSTGSGHLNDLWEYVP